MTEGNFNPNLFDLFLKNGALSINRLNCYFGSRINSHGHLNLY